MTRPSTDSHPRQLGSPTPAVVTADPLLALELTERFAGLRADCSPASPAPTKPTCGTSTPCCCAPRAASTGGRAPSTSAPTWTTTPSGPAPRPYTSAARSSSLTRTPRPRSVDGWPGTADPGAVPDEP